MEIRLTDLLFTHFEAFGFDNMSLFSVVSGNSPSSHTPDAGVAKSAFHHLVSLKNFEGTFSIGLRALLLVCLAAV